LTVLRPDGSACGHWTLRGAGAPDLAAVDWLARVRLAAARAGGSAIVDEVTPALADLLALAGLGDLLCR
jgi:hypothetical protein